MTFLERDVPALGDGRRLFRLGLAPSYGIDEKGIRAGLDHGMNYLFYGPMKGGHMKKVVRSLSASQREKLVIAATPGLGYFGWSVRFGIERVLKALKTDYLDVAQLGWLGVTSAYTTATLAALERLKEQGKVRFSGVSIHDRPRAAKLVESGPLELFMVRYNAAHPGAEREIFPSLEKRKPAVIAFTATRWGKLLKAPRGWKGPVPTAGDCYRFCLSNDNIDVVLTGPKSAEELTKNLADIQKGPLSEDEQKWMREFGKAVHG